MGGIPSHPAPRRTAARVALSPLARATPATRLKPLPRDAQLHVLRGGANTHGAPPPPLRNPSLARLISWSSATAARDPPQAQNNPNDFAAIVRELRAKGELARLPREHARATLSADILGEMLDLDDEDASSLLAQLRDGGVKTVGALLTAATDISKDPTTGLYSAKGDLAAVNVPGALRQITALRDRVERALDADVMCCTVFTN